MDQANLTYRPRTGSFSRGTPNMWTTAYGNEELGLVYMPMGNSAGNYLNSDYSAAEVPYSTALVAIDVLTGKPVWHSRSVDIDMWGYCAGDASNVPLGFMSLTKKFFIIVAWTWMLMKILGAD
jgi:quinoprotein glucose dehydrogenase